MTERSLEEPETGEQVTYVAYHKTATLDWVKVTWLSYGQRGADEDVAQSVIVHPYRETTRLCMRLRTVKLVPLVVVYIPIEWV